MYRIANVGKLSNEFTKTNCYKYLTSPLLGQTKCGPYYGATPEDIEQKTYSIKSINPNICGRPIAQHLNKLNNELEKLSKKAHVYVADTAVCWYNELGKKQQNLFQKPHSPFVVNIKGNNNNNYQLPVRWVKQKSLVKPKKVYKRISPEFLSLLKQHDTRMLAKCPLYGLSSRYICGKSIPKPEELTVVQSTMITTKRSSTFIQVNTDAAKKKFPNLLFCKVNEMEQERESLPQPNIVQKSSKPQQKEVIPNFPKKNCQQTCQQVSVMPNKPNEQQSPLCNKNPSYIGINNVNQNCMNLSTPQTACTKESCFYPPEPFEKQCSKNCIMDITISSENISNRTKKLQPIWTNPRVAMRREIQLDSNSSSDSFIEKKLVCSGKHQKRDEKKAKYPRSEPRVDCKTLPQDEVVQRISDNWLKLKKDLSSTKSTDSNPKCDPRIHFENIIMPVLFEKDTIVYPRFEPRLPITEPYPEPEPPTTSSAKNNLSKKFTYFHAKSHVLQKDSTPSIYLKNNSLGPGLSSVKQKIVSYPRLEPRCVFRRIPKLSPSNSINSTHLQSAASDEASIRREHNKMYQPSKMANQKCKSDEKTIFCRNYPRMEPRLATENQLLTDIEADENPNALGECPADYFTTDYRLMDENSDSSVENEKAEPIEQNKMENPKPADPEDSTENETASKFQYFEDNEKKKSEKIMCSAYQRGKNNKITEPKPQPMTPIETPKTEAQHTTTNANCTKSGKKHSETRRVILMDNTEVKIINSGLIEPIAEASETTVQIEEQTSKQPEEQAQNREEKEYPKDDDCGLCCMVEKTCCREYKKVLPEKIDNVHIQKLTTTQNRVVRNVAKRHESCFQDSLAVAQAIPLFTKRPNYYHTHGLDPRPRMPKHKPKRDFSKSTNLGHRHYNCLTTPTIQLTPLPERSKKPVYKSSQCEPVDRTNYHAQCIPEEPPRKVKKKIRQELDDDKKLTEVLYVNHSGERYSGKKLTHKKSTTMIQYQEPRYWYEHVTNTETDKNARKVTRSSILKNKKVQSGQCSKKTQQGVEPNWMPSMKQKPDYILGQGFL